MPSGILAEMCHADFDAWEPQVAVIPVGSTEVHARHLPFGADTIQVEAITRRAVIAANGAGARVLAVPVIPFSVDGNLMAFKYTINAPPSLLLEMIRTVVDSLSHHGIRKFLIVNGHGGNTAAVRTICRELFGGPFLACIDYWKIAWDVIEATMETGEYDHADEFETSSVLALRPELVRMDLAEKTATRKHHLPTLSKYGGDFSRPWEHYTINGGVGDPTKATAAKGDKVIAATVERLRDILVELSNADMNESFPY